MIVFSFPFFQFSRRSITFYSMGKPEINIDILRTIMCCVLCCFEGFPRDALHFFSFLFVLSFLIIKITKVKTQKTWDFLSSTKRVPWCPSHRIFSSSFTFHFLSSIRVSFWIFRERNLIFFRSHSFCFEKLKIKTNWIPRHVLRI